SHLTLPTPALCAPPIPLFDPEVPLKSVVPSVARTLGLITLGTFNERQGDQLLLRGDQRVGVWGRVFGQGTREHFAEGARPDFDGTFAGFQAGADLLRLESISGHSDHIGFYVAQARASGGVHGLVDAFEGAPPVTSTSMPPATAAIGPTLVRRTGISTRCCRGPISRLLQTPSVAWPIISAGAALRLRSRAAIRSR